MKVMLSQTIHVMVGGASEARLPGTVVDLDSETASAVIQCGAGIAYGDTPAESPEPSEPSKPGRRKRKQ